MHPIHLAVMAWFKGYEAELRGAKPLRVPRHRVVPEPVLVKHAGPSNSDGLLEHSLLQLRVPICRLVDAINLLHSLVPVVFGWFRPGRLTRLGKPVVPPWLPGILKPHRLRALLCRFAGDLVVP